MKMAACIKIHVDYTGTIGLRSMDTSSLTTEAAHQGAVTIDVGVGCVVTPGGGPTVTASVIDVDTLVCRSIGSI